MSLQRMGDRFPDGDLVADGLLLRADILHEDKQYVNAIEAYETLLQRFMDYQEIDRCYFELALCRRAVGKADPKSHEKALAALQTLLDRFPRGRFLTPAL